MAERSPWRKREEKEEEEDDDDDVFLVFVYAVRSAGALFLP